METTEWELYLYLDNGKARLRRFNAATGGNEYKDVQPTSSSIQKVDNG